MEVRNRKGIYGPQYNGYDWVLKYPVCPGKHYIPTSETGISPCSNFEKPDI